MLALIINNEVEEANEKLEAAGVRVRFAVELRVFEDGESEISNGLIVLWRKEARFLEVRLTASHFRTVLLDIGEVTGAEPFELAFDECTRSLWRDITIRMIRQAVLN